MLGFVCLTGAVLVQVLLADSSPRMDSRRDVLIKDCLPWSGLYALNKQTPACCLLYAQTIICMFTINFIAGGFFNYSLYRWGWSVTDMFIFGTVIFSTWIVSALVLTYLFPLQTIYRKIFWPAAYGELVLLVISGSPKWWMYITIPT